MPFSVSGAGVSMYVSGLKNRICLAKNLQNPIFIFKRLSHKKHDLFFQMSHFSFMVLQVYFY